MTNVHEHNRKSWNIQSTSGECRWAEPVDSATIAAAALGDWSVVLTPTLTVPNAWFGDLKGKDVLCLASGGGQQVPVLAAAGANVTSFDASDEQLAKDRLVADRDDLAITCIRGDMADLNEFDNASFDLIFHPVANVFAANVRIVWQECFRVLRNDGRLLSGFMNPDFFLFDHDEIESGGPMTVTYGLPYSDLESLAAEQLETRLKDNAALVFSHSLDDQIGGQIDAGFVIAGFYEDRWDDAATPLNRYMPTSMATLAIKPAISDASRQP